jgi:hypothetical protein
VIAAVAGNMQEVYRVYAYRYYYGHTDLKQARHCMLESLKIGVTNKRDFIFLVLFCLPVSVVNSLKLMKRQLPGNWLGFVNRWCSGQ